MKYPYWIVQGVRDQTNPSVDYDWHYQTHEEAEVAVVSLKARGYDEAWITLFHD